MTKAPSRKLIMEDEVGPSPIGESSGESGPGRRAARRRRFSSRGITLALLIPLSGLILLPIGMMFFGAVHTAPFGDDRRLTLHALEAVYTTAPFLRSLGGTVLLAVIVAIGSTALGAVFAWLLNRTDMPGKKWLEVVVMAPLFLSPFIGAVAWITLAAPRSGIVNVLARQVFEIDEPVVNVMTIGGVIWVLLLYYTPYGYLFTSAALKNMDPSLEDASHVSGAGLFETIRRVTLPMARPAMAAAFFFISVLAMGVFSVPDVLGAQVGFQPLAVRIQRAVHGFPADYAVAASIGTLLFLFTVVGVWLYKRSIRASNRFVSITARGYRPRVAELGRMRPFAALLCVLYGLFAVVLPYLALILVALTPYVMTDFRQVRFTTNHLVSVVTSPQAVSALQNTLTIAIFAASVCVFLGLVTAFTVERLRVPGHGFIEYIATLPIAIPGIVFGTGMVWAYIRTPLYATLTILVLAYVASYLPHSLRLTTNGLMQIDRALEEASTVNGARSAHTLRRITLPLSKPAMLSAWVLVFIFTVREINTAIVLISPRSTILSVMTWDMVREGRIASAAVVGLLQSALLVLGVVLARFVFKVKLSSAQS